MGVGDLIAGAVQRFDGWVNALTGVGGGSRTAGYSYRRDLPLTYWELSDLFHGDGIATRICDAIPGEALRKGFTLSCGDPALEERVNSTIDSLSIPERFSEAWTFARAFGGAVVFIGADDGQDPIRPLQLDAVRRVTFLAVLDANEIYANSWNGDPDSPRFGEPETYRLSRVGSTNADTRVIHASRVIRFDGAITTRERRRQNPGGWHDSELQRCFDRLRQFNGAFAAVEDLLQQSSQGVFKVKDLFKMMVGKAEATLKQRLELLNMGMSVSKAVMVDADGESFERTEVGALSGLPPTLDKFMLLLSAVTRIPVTVLMGQSPAGLNATGDSDIRWFYDRIATDQTRYLRPRINQLLRIILRSQQGPAGGVEPENWQVRFPSLYQLTPAEEADLRLKQSQVDAAYINAGVLTPDEVAINRFAEGGYSTETKIDLQPRKLQLELDKTPPTTPSPTEPPSIDPNPQPSPNAGNDGTG
jgi:phage-related protein (TIGR01555 family)